MSKPTFRGRDTKGREVWQLRVALGRTPDGEYPVYSERFHGSITLANRRLRKLHQLKDEGRLTALTTTDTVSDALEGWYAALTLAGKRSGGAYSPDTLARYRSIIDTSLAPAFGSVRLPDLTVEMVEDWHRDRLAEVSPATVRKEHNCLAAALRKCVRQKLLFENVADLAETTPSPGHHSVTTLNEDELAKLLTGLKAAATEERDPASAPPADLYAIVAVAVQTGMRRGELLRLTWADVDLDAAVLSVKKSKTRTGRRSIPLSSATVAVLREHRTRQRAQRLAAKKWTDHGLVFPQTHRRGTLGGPWHPDSLTHAFDRETRKLGFDIRFHDLRHTHATILLRRGVHPKIVQERLGHATIAVTLDTYSHVLPDMQQAAVSALDAVFGA
ncbi:MAG: site-specific integrase [Anaerovoracaceae bacterium]|jgi:integrase